jgi:hypothetical protein
VVFFPQCGEIPCNRVEFTKEFLCSLLALVLLMIKPGEPTMKRRITLLLSLILIGTLGLAAGIDASKGNWDYHSLLKETKVLHSTPIAVSGSLSLGKLLSFVSPTGQENGSPSTPHIVFFRTEGTGQPGLLVGDAPFITASAGATVPPKKLALFVPASPQEGATKAPAGELTNPANPELRPPVELALAR